MMKWHYMATLLEAQQKVDYEVTMKNTSVSNKEWLKQKKLHVLERQNVFCKLNF